MNKAKSQASAKNRFLIRTRLETRESADFDSRCLIRSRHPNSDQLDPTALYSNHPSYFFLYSPTTLRSTRVIAITGEIQSYVRSGEDAYPSFRSYRT
ncbi:hypothetical protein PPACK8108_LOCUS14188 [Phakopsora pachyrhizi]|uniref:Uncharacterized protein n=1 Tax=Phakopsora pachyrhizi TaxID=170000 RepID=A0AAV0B6R0_PHAPC|nr:hypothetical protein PPACK8108_LOCUS14188 [Phakopsora pachyrhizi]